MGEARRPRAFPGLAIKVCDCQAEGFLRGARAFAPSPQLCLAQARRALSQAERPAWTSKGSTFKRRPWRTTWAATSACALRRAAPCTSRGERLRNALLCPGLNFAPGRRSPLRRRRRRIAALLLSWALGRLGLRALACCLLVSGGSGPPQAGARSSQLPPRQPAF